MMYSAIVLGAPLNVDDRREPEGELGECHGGNEFIRRLQKYAKKQRLALVWRPDRGKGSHGLLILGDRRAVVRNPKDELKTGTYHAMLKQLGITETDLS